MGIILTNQKVSLADKFKQSLYMDESNARQAKGSLAAVGVGYTGTAVLSALQNDFYNAVVKNFQWEHIPLHAMFILALGFIGAASVAVYDKIQHNRSRNNVSADEGSNTTTDSSKPNTQQPDQEKPGIQLHP
jgi:hypothetical protein